VDAVWRDDEEWERLPLFPELAPVPALLLDGENRVFADPFLAELAHSRPLQRLKNIGFLGALDYIRPFGGYAARRAGSFQPPGSCTTSVTDRCPIP
jgi:uncharacterized protein